MQPSLSQLSPFIYSEGQLTYIGTNDFPHVYETENGPIFPQIFFNGSIVLYKGKLLFCCRADQKPWFDNIRLVVCELDFNFVPIKDTIKLLNVGSDRGFYHVEDPRLVIINDRLNLIYGDGYRVYHAILKDDLRVEKWKNITNFGLMGLKEHDTREKNWTPFDYKGELAIIYSDAPRTIYFPYTGKVIFSEQNIEWEFGQIRGGTPAIKWDNSYITFFHSALNEDKKTWFNGRTYFMGAYIFNLTPPFKVTKITKIPLMKGEDSPKNPIAEVVKVVFPAGITQTHDSFFVSLGANDSSTGVLRVSKSLIAKILEPV
jgi:predicted GH43/DUF377 family glycosyl hydrolase